MKSFKVGDRVKCRRDFYDPGSPKKDQVFTVKSVTANYIGVECPDLKDSFYSADTRTGLHANWGIDCFVLDECESVEDLLKKANEGILAREELIKMGVKFEGKRNGPEWHVYDPFPLRFVELRLAQKEFECFRTGNWDVRVVDGNIHIGCKHFNIKNFKTVLISSVNLNGIGISTPEGSFSPCKDGIKYEGYILSWADAEEILKRLNEMEK